MTRGPTSGYSLASTPFKRIISMLTGNFVRRSLISFYFHSSDSKKSISIRFTSKVLAVNTPDIIIYHVFTQLIPIYQHDFDIVLRFKFPCSPTERGCGNEYPFGGSFAGQSTDKFFGTSGRSTTLFQRLAWI